MTNNEIIKFLQSKQIPQCGDKEYTADEEYEAYQRAIDALEQQPCDDAISRQNEINCNYTDEEIAKSFISDVEAVKDLLPRGENEDK